MLNFRNTNIACIILFAVLLGLHFAYGLSGWYILVLFILYTLLLFYGSYFVHSNFYIPVICSGKGDRKEIALSFDDGPVSEFTPGILKILKDENVAAAFFCIGKNILPHEGLLRRIHDEGHLIGNHSFSHDAWFDLFSPGKMLSDLRAMDEAMHKATGLRPRLFRPPYGVTNPNVKKAILRGDYIPIGWNVRSLDTVIRDEKKLMARVLSGLKPGAILLFHDTGRATLNILPHLIAEIRQQGYTIRRLDKMLNLEPYV